MKTKVVMQVLGAAVALAGLTVGSARASTVGSLFTSGLNTAHDVDLEYQSVDLSTGLNPDGSAKTAGHLDVGDVVTGYLTISQLLNSSGAALGLNSGNDQLTAFFDVQVTNKINIGGGQFAFTFGPDNSGQKFVNGSVNAGGSTFQSLYGTGAMVAVYTANSGQANYLTNTLSAGTSIATAASGVTAGSLFWSLGFSNPGTANTGTGGSFGPPIVGNTSGSNEGWAAVGSDNFALGGVNTGSILGNVNFALSLLPGGTGPTSNLLAQTIDPSTSLASDTKSGASVMFIGSSTLRGAGNSSSFAATSDSDLTFLVAAAPLPSAAWSGIAMLGLLGAGALLRRRSVA